MDDTLRAEELQHALTLSEKLNIPFLRLTHYDIPKEAAELLTSGLMTPKIASNYRIIPVAKFGPVVTVAMADPLNVLVVDELRSLMAMEITPVVGMASDILEAIEIHCAPSSRLDEMKLDETARPIAPSAKPSVEFSGEEVDVYRLTEISAKESIIKTVNNFLMEAIRSRASDIHIEPYEKEIRLRYRIDGALRKIETFTTDMQDAIYARVKIMSRLDITQRRIPQDGRFSINFESRDIDFRVSILPTYYGEKAVLRILDKKAIQLDLVSLGFSPKSLETYVEAISSPFGLILVTGPTGSGKSTTLYSMLTKLNTFDRNIVTIEDPIEYYLKGVTQIQIKPDIGLSFAQCLKSVLRQSPDIIMVGEIRDLETADVAMKAALTGHLVLTTLHTNDALSSITRLMDMGLETFLIAGSLRMVSAQRLCRRLCPSCKEKYVATKEYLKRFSIEIEQDQIELYRPKGCSACSNTGYKGRQSIVEAVLVDEGLKDMIIKKVPLATIKEHACSLGMKSLREDGFLKVISGEVSLEEVFRVSI